MHNTEYRISFGNQIQKDTHAVILLTNKKNLKNALTHQLNTESGGLIEHIINNQKEDVFTEKTYYINKAGKLQTLVIISASDSLSLNSEIQKLGGRAFVQAKSTSQEKVAVVYGVNENAQSGPAQVAYGFKLASYSFNKYKTKKKSSDTPKSVDCQIVCDNTLDAEKQFPELMEVVSGVFLARDLVSEPGNVLYPASYAHIIKEQLEPVGVKVTILDEEELLAKSMNALLCIGQGSTKESRMVVMEWNGDPSSKDKIALVGKGITFDTGGISLKPSNGMWDMKYDMAGSAAVVGTLRAMAGKKAKKNIVGIVALAENMPSGNAIKPGDIVTSMSGQTIEILNTDAEGRVVLADALHYATTFNPSKIIDLATLTGAASIAVGPLYAAILTNNDDLHDGLSKAGEVTTESLWRLPLTAEYDKYMDSKIADIQNISSLKGGPGVITAAKFLERFVDGKPWAHLDIASVAWNNKATDTGPEGASGFGVKLLDEFITHN